MTTGITTSRVCAAATYTADKVENMGAGASYQFGKLLVHGLYTRVKLETPGYSDTYQSYDAGANYQFTPANTRGRRRRDDDASPAIAGRSSRSATSTRCRSRRSCT